MGIGADDSNIVYPSYKIVRQNIGFSIYTSEIRVTMPADNESPC